MTSSTLDVYNQALSACHAKGRLATVSDNTRERQELDIWYDNVVSTVQEAAYWPGSKVLAALTLADTRDFSVDWNDEDPAPEFKYKYELPANCLRPWHLTNYDRFALHFDVTNDATYLSTNTKDAVLVYALKQLDVTKWTQSQITATVYALAAHVGGPLTGNYSLIRKNTDLANNILMDAQVAANHGEDQMLNALPSSLVARGYSGLVDSPRFLYPHGSIFTAAVTDA